MRRTFCFLLRGFFVSAQLLLMPLISHAAEPSFPDVPADSPYAPAISWLKENAIVNGYPDDGTFRPNNTINRAEIAKILILGEKIIPNTPAANCFPDVPKNTWFASFICEGTVRAFFKGYPDGTFGPAKMINRAEGVKMVCNLKKWRTEMPQTSPFIDTRETEWYTPCIAYAKENGYLKSIADGRLFFPAKEMTRAEFGQLYYLASGNTASTELSPAISGNFAAFKNQMLDLVNKERESRGFSRLQWSDELMAVAELHSTDMAENSFFNHTNPAGESPDDRRMKAGVKTLVGENIAIAPSIETAHEGFMNSPPHKENILNPAWERVGIGIAQNEHGSLLVTQLFSTNPVTQEDMQQAQEVILKTFPFLAFDESLTSLAHLWNIRMMSEDFFSAISPNGVRLTTEALEKTDATRVSISLAKGYEIEKLQNQISSASYPETARRIGIALDMDERGIIYVTAIATD